MGTEEGSSQRVCNAHCARRLPPPGGSRVGGSPKTGNSRTEDAEQGKEDANQPDNSSTV
ncbi:hypothetical protein PI125_g22398 [Phytophthora idaei]|nr:hypothetical protein PI125_g22398 [Phytophthora idaei]